LNRTRNMAS